MTGEEIKALRRALDLTARKLGETIGVDQATVLSWEREELFPTKRHVEAMRGLLEKKGEAASGGMRGGDAKEEAKEKSKEGLGEGIGEEIGEERIWRGLSDPQVWRLLRKVLAFEDLRGEVMRLAETYPDPTGE